MKFKKDDIIIAKEEIPIIVGENLQKGTKIKVINTIQTGIKGKIINNVKGYPKGRVGHISSRDIHYFKLYKGKIRKL